MGERESMTSIQRRLVSDVSEVEAASATIRLTTGADAEVWAFKNLPGAEQDDNLLLVRGDFTETPPIVRIHSSCVTGDLYHSAQCDCGSQLKEALELISEQGGAIIYLHQEGRGIGLFNKMRAYSEKEKGLDTYEANRVLGFPEDARDFQVAAEMLKMVGLTEIRLLTNNPRKIAQLKKYGIKVSEVISTGIFKTPQNEQYLEAKESIGGHMFRET